MHPGHGVKRHHVFVALLYGLACSHTSKPLLTRSQGNALASTASHEAGDVKGWRAASGELSMIVNSIGEAPYVMRVRVRSAMFSDYGKVLLLAVDDGCGGMVSSFNTESGKSIGERGRSFGQRALSAPLL